jgi:hypothetical protein
MRLPCPPDIRKLDGEAAVFLDNKAFKLLTSNTDLLRGSTLRAHNSRFNVWKWNSNNTLTNELTLKKNLKGFEGATPLDLKVQRTMTAIGNENRNYEKAFHDFAGVPKAGVARSLVGRVQEFAGKIDRKTFEDRVRWGLSNGNVDRLGDVNVNKAISIQRRILDRGNKRLKEVGLLDDIPDSVAFAKTYFPRRYSRAAIIEGRTNDAGETIEQLFTRKFQEQHPDMNAAAVKDSVDNAIAKITGMDDEHLVLNAATDHVMNHGSLKGFLKERQIQIDDSELFPWMSEDVLGTVSNFGMQAEALAAMKEQFEIMGRQVVRPIEKVSDITKLLREELAQLSDEAATRLEGDALKKELSNLQQEFVNAQEELIAQWRLATGQYGSSKSPHLRALKKYNAMTMLGGVTLASIPDVAMLIFKNGFGKVANDFIGRFGTAWKETKKSREQILLLDGVIDKHMDEVIRQQTDPSFIAGASTKTVWGKKFNQAASIFTSLTGISFLNRTVASIGADIQVNALADAFIKNKAGKGIAFTKDQVAQWARIGIGKDQYKIIRRNLKHVQQTDGRTFHNIELWDDEAQKLVGDAILRDQTVLRPTAGDLPLWAMKNEIGGVIFQFKSFLSAAHNRILVAGAQRAAIKGPAGALTSKEMQGMAALIGMGAMSYMIREELAGRGDDTDFSVDNLIVEGILRSGVGGLLADPLALVLPGERSGRFAALGAMGLFGGPSLAQGARAVEVLNGALDGELKEGELKKAARLAPYNNLFYIQGFFNALGD